MQQTAVPVGPEGPKQIMRLNAQSGKGWLESTDASSEELFVQFCSALYQHFPKPTLTENQLYSKLEKLAVPNSDGDAGDSWLEVFRKNMLELREKTGYELSIYEAWWAYCHSSLFAEEMKKRVKISGAYNLCEKQVAKTMRLGEYDPRRHRSSVSSVWSFFCERHAGQRIGEATLVLANRAVSGDMQAMTGYFKAFKPVLALSRSENSIAVSRVKDREVDPTTMSLDELDSYILALTKAVGGEAQNSMANATWLDDEE